MIRGRDFFDWLPDVVSDEVRETAAVLVVLSCRICSVGFSPRLSSGLRGALRMPVHRVL